MLNIKNITLLASLLVACSGDKDQTDDTSTTDNSGTTSATDLDGDGIADENDLDADGDGIPATEDCDDQSADVLSSSEDLDCDGTPDSEDSDQDGDGVDAAEDCDDRNPDSTSTQNDADCDGVPAEQDCDDANSEVGSSLNDVDCDGHPGYEDCDDRDPNSTFAENDGDCDGIVNEDDAFPDDAGENFDSDGDGVGDNSDLCEGGDDSIDEDGNGVPDYCDGPGWLNCYSDRELDTADFHVVGLEEGEWAGVDVSYAGDVDGDGLEDLLIGTNRTYVPDTIGRAYLVLGSSIIPGETFDLANADYVFIGEQDNDAFGQNVAGIGDYDGDGLDDLLFGAAWYTNGQGRAYMVLGSSLGSESTIYIENADTTFTTSNASHLGQELAAVGDVNGDGLADIMIGQSSKANLFLGTQSIELERDVGSADLIIEGGSGLGNALSTAGDVDGDGLDDLLIAQPHFPQSGYYKSGRVHLVMGSSIGSQTTMSIDDSDFKFNSYADAALGTEIAAAGDVDGDGLDDIIMGTSASDINGENKGSVYFMLGSTIVNDGATDFRVDNEADYRMIGVYNNDYLGSAMAPAGDFNGDGLDDFLIAASGSDYAGQYLGVVYLFSGASLPYLAVGNEIIPEAADFRFPGQFGVGGVGRLSKRSADWDGDGLDDILVSSHGAFNDKGLVSIFNNCE